jgi:uncharacterized protein (TIGR03084 family)
VPTVEELCQDLGDEQATLDVVLDGLVNDDWRLPTPATGWDVRDSVSHLCFFEEAAAQAISDPEGFEAHRQQTLDAMAATALGQVAGGAPDVALGRAIERSTDLLDRWRSARTTYIAAALKADPKTRVPWFGPSMSLASFTTARLMEAWAHGADIRDALAVPIQPSQRLRHICHLSYGARAYSFTVHGIEDPGDPVHLAVAAPDGTEWAWGPAEAANHISGPALDVALVFTQRRHRSRTEVRAAGPVAELWLSIAQAFAGPPTTTAPDR